VVPLQSIAAPAVVRNGLAHLYKAFGERSRAGAAALAAIVASVVDTAKEELLSEVPVLQRLLARSDARTAKRSAP